MIRKFAKLQLPHIFNSNREVCEYMNISYIDSTDSRKKVEKELSRYCKWHKQGRKYIITEVFDDPLPKVDGRKNNGGGNAIEYIIDLEYAIIDFLKSQLNWHVQINSYPLFETIGIINEDFSKARYNYQRTAFYHELNEANTKYSFDYINRLLFSHVDKALNSLSSKDIISWRKDVWITQYGENVKRIVINEDFNKKATKFVEGDRRKQATPITKLASPEEIKLIEQCKKEAKEHFDIKGAMSDKAIQYYNKLLFDRHRIGFVWIKYDIKLLDKYDEKIEANFYFDSINLNDKFAKRIINNCTSTMKNRNKRKKEEYIKKHETRVREGKSLGIPNPIEIEKIERYNDQQLKNLKQIVDLFVRKISIKKRGDTMKIDFSCRCGQIEHEEQIIDGEKKIVCSQCGEVYYTGSALREQDKSNTLCTNCGNRGFKPSNPDKNGTPTYECTSCGSIVYTLHDLMETEKRKKERDYEA